MSSSNDIENAIRQATCEAPEALRRRLWDDVAERRHPRKALASGDARTATQRTTWRSPVTRLAAAATFMGAMGLLIGVLLHAPRPAYALEQTIEAHHGVCFLHIKDFDFSTGETEPREFWIACDARGEIERVRCYIPAWDGGPQDGPKSIVWQQGVTKTWLHWKNSLVMIRDESIPEWMSELMQRADPRGIIERLRESEKQGKLTLQIEQPADRHKPILATVGDLSEGSPTGRQQILYIDQVTKRVAAIDYRRLDEGSPWVCKKRLEYLDYDVPISADRFALEREVPADAVRIDRVTQDVGLAQGNLSEEEAVREVLRQFFAALQVGDYREAGLLKGGYAAQNMEDEYGDLKVVRVLSIGQPQPDPSRGDAFFVPCEVEVENGDGTTRVERYPRCFIRRVNARTQPICWYINGGL
jgi:hypothetical protein